MKKGKWSLSGELSAAPGLGFNYAETRKRITSRILSFKRDEEKSDQPPFSGVTSFEVKEDGGFVVTLRGSHQFGSMGSKEGEREEAAIVELLAGLQAHCGVGAEVETERGVLSIAYFTDFKNQTEE